MWWCCGKRGKDQPGCKFQKHESKDDDDDLENEKNSDPANLKYVRCLCCKELGHRIDHCHRDPNMRTNERDHDLDLDRIKRIKDFKTLHGDTMI